MGLRVSRVLRGWEDRAYARCGRVARALGVCKEQTCSAVVSDESASPQVAVGWPMSSSGRGLKEKESQEVSQDVRIAVRLEGGDRCGGGRGETLHESLWQRPERRATTSTEIGSERSRGESSLHSAVSRVEWRDERVVGLNSRE